MQRLSVGWVVLQGIVLACALSWVGPLAAEPLTGDSLQKPAAKEEIPEINQAMEKLRKGDQAGALADFKAAREKHPKLSPAEIMMARSFANVNQAGPMRFWLERAVAQSPGDPEAYTILGQDALGAKRVAEARLLFEKAHQLLQSYDADAERKKALQTLTIGPLASLAVDREDWDTAKGYLNELLKLHPNNDRALQSLALVLFKQGDISGALEKLKAAKTADMEVLTPEAVLAGWFEKDGDRESARKYMVEAINAAPRDFKTRFAAGNWAFQAQSFDQARKQADIALKLAGDGKLDPSPALILAGTIAVFQNDYPAAEAYLRKAVAEAPASFSASNNLALALCEQDDASKQKLALQYARINRKLYPEDIEAASTLGRVFFRLKRFRESDAVYRKVLTSGRSLSPDTVYCVAALYTETNRRDEARKLLTEAVKSKGLFSQRENAKKLLESLGS